LIRSKLLGILADASIGHAVNCGSVSTREIHCSLGVSRILLITIVKWEKSNENGNGSRSDRQCLCVARRRRLCFIRFIESLQLWAIDICDRLSGQGWIMWLVQRKLGVTYDWGLLQPQDGTMLWRVQ